MHAIHSPSPLFLLKLAITAWLAALLGSWLAADLRVALDFWPGVLMGTLGTVVGWRRWPASSVHRSGHRQKLFTIVLFLWLALGLLPQRDIHLLAAPFGVWFALTVAAGMDRLRW